MTKQLVRVIAAEYVKNFEIRLRFNDGAVKTVDFSRWLRGEVFKPLSNKRHFKTFFVSGGTVCWPNGADVAPETLYASKDVSSSAA
jgi:hypothetical protein